jgi:hypothetical protein
LQERRNQRFSPKFQFQEKGKSVKKSKTKTEIGKNDIHGFHNNCVSMKRLVGRYGGDEKMKRNAKKSTRIIRGLAAGNTDEIRPHSGRER